MGGGKNTSKYIQEKVAEKNDAKKKELKKSQIAASKKEGGGRGQEDP